MQRKSRIIIIVVMVIILVLIGVFVIMRRETESRNDDLGQETESSVEESSTYVIPRTKDEIVEVFTENFEHFEAIAEFFLEDPRQFQVYYGGGEFYVSELEPDEESESAENNDGESRLSECEIFGDIEYVIYELDFSCIEDYRFDYNELLDYDRNVEFAESNCDGVIYSEWDEELLERRFTSLEKITDNWYYYMRSLP